MSREPLMRCALEQMLKQFKDGRPETVLFTTFNFNAQFFEANILPLLAGNSVDELKGGVEARMQLNAALQQTKTLVVCDRSARPEPKGDFRYGLMPVGLEKGRFHPKIILMSGTLADSSGSGLWLSVGSGNLSLSGWAVNREIVGTIPVASKHRPGLSALLRWLLWTSEERINWLSKDGSDVERVNSANNEEGNTRSILETLIDSLGKNCIVDRDATDLPSFHLSLPSHPPGSELPISKALITELSGDKSWKRATIVSPFWADVTGLMKEVHVEQFRFVPSVRPDGNYSFPLELLTADKEKNDKCSFLRFQQEGDRYTHAKAILFENDEERVLCIGSANFTTAALMTGTGLLSNVEVMLRYSKIKGDPWKGLFTDLAKDKLVSSGDDPADEGAPQLPPFEADVLCDWKAKKFYCRFKVHKGENITAATLEVAGNVKPLEVSSEKEQVLEFPFRGNLPVRNFLIDYGKGAENLAHYQGIIIQLNAADDDLGYRPRPRLSRILELLRNLDPAKSANLARRRAGEKGDVDDDDGGSAEPTFDFFRFFQATYKLRHYYAKHSELDPFNENAPQGIPVLFRAVTLQQAVTPESQIERYVQLAELLETVIVLRNRKSTSPQSEHVAMHFQECIETELKDLEVKISSLLRESDSFRNMFGHSVAATKVDVFLAWFRNELKEQLHE